MLLMQEEYEALLIAPLFVSAYKILHTNIYFKEHYNIFTSILVAVGCGILLPSL